MTQSRRRQGGSEAGGASPRTAAGRSGAQPPRPLDPGSPLRSGRGDSVSSPFWKKPLAELTRREWEALCDGCGRCCLVKLEDEDTGEIHFTGIACRLFDSGACRCRSYTRRFARVADCVKLTPENVDGIAWLPPTCAYRLRREGRDLPDWHPLVSGDPETVHTAGVSARGKVTAFEDDLPLEDYPDYIAAWPGKWPRGAKKPGKAKK